MYMYILKCQQHINYTPYMHTCTFWYTQKQTHTVYMYRQTYTVYIHAQKQTHRVYMNIQTHTVYTHAHTEMDT